MTAVGIPSFFSDQISGATRFHLDLSHGRKSALAVVSGGVEHCAPDYEIHRKSLPFWGIEFVAQGSGTVAFGGREIPLTAGSVFSYGPRTAHDIITDRHNPLVKYFVDFSGSRAGGFLGAQGPAPGKVVQTSAPGELMGVLDELIRSGLRPTPFTGRIAVVLLEMLVLKIAETSIPNGSFASPAFATYRRCRQFIQDHWLEVGSLAGIADACHIDSAYLCRLFRKYDRQSPYQLVLRLKVGHAADCLGRGMPVADVADKLGFADPFHFSRVFKKHMGMAPSVFSRLRCDGYRP